MNTQVKTARNVGALFLVVNVAFIAGALSIESILSSPDYLAIAFGNRTQMVLGVLLELLNGLAYIGIAVLMYPILKQRYESLALGYLGFRFVEFVMQILADISPLALLSLSEEFVRAGAPEAASFQTAGVLLLAGRYWAFQMVSITFGLSALMFYTMLYRSKLIPRWLSGWGLVGSVVVLANAIMDMFDFPPGNLGVLMLLNEVVLGVWLIVRGFNSPAIASESANEI